MIYCILAKLSASALGSFLGITKLSDNPLAASFLIGVLPIWLEVLASNLTKVEPARERRLNIKIIDNIVDGIVFILVPAIWYSVHQGPDAPILIFVLIFALAGIWRLVKFVKNGLSENFFVGLPVTYTGYLWPLLILMEKIPHHNLLILILAWAMNSKHIKIKAPNYEIT